MICSVPDWENKLVVDEAYELVKEHSGKRWCTLNPAEALQFLDPLYWNETVLMIGKKTAR